MLTNNLINILDQVFPGINELFTTASQLISELGEINKFPKRSSLARFAGIFLVFFEHLFALIPTKSGDNTHDKFLY
jgi:hypothetical protein